MCYIIIAATLLLSAGTIIEFKDPETEIRFLLQKNYKGHKSSASDPVKIVAQ